MSSSGAVAVRIPRGPRQGATVEVEPVATPPVPDPNASIRVNAEGSTPDPTGAPRWENRAGVQRSLRLFVLGFLLLPLVVFGTFSTVILTSRYQAVREGGWPFLGYLGAILAATVVVGFFLTLWRTPRAFQMAPSGLLRVTPWVGSPSALKLSSRSSAGLLEYYSPGPLSSKGVELLEVISPPQRARRWIVEEDLLNEVLPRRSIAAGRRASDAKVAARSELPEDPAGMPKGPRGD